VRAYFPRRERKSHHAGFPKPEFVIPSSFHASLAGTIHASSLTRRRRMTKNSAIFVSPKQLAGHTARSRKRPRRSVYAAVRKARFLPGSGLVFFSIRRRIAAHLFSSSAIWRASSATPIAEIGVVRRNSASHVSKATLLLGIMRSFVFTVWS
jgi:hypothetical protein